MINDQYAIYAYIVGIYRILYAIYARHISHTVCDICLARNTL